MYIHRQPLPISVMMEWKEQGGSYEFLSCCSQLLQFDITLVRLTPDACQLVACLNSHYWFTHSLELHERESR